MVGKHVVFVEKKTHCLVNFVKVNFNKIYRKSVNNISYLGLIFALVNSGNF